MAVRARLSDGRELLIQATLDDLERALRVARAHDSLIRVEQADGSVIAVAPEAIETLQEAPEEAGALARRLTPA
ncbi:MAG: hypothetical protein ACYCUM_13140 [Solirubrobacteraceae bacterium]